MDYRKKYAELLKAVCELKEQYAYRSVQNFYAAAQKFDTTPHDRELRQFSAGRISEEQAIVKDLEKIISVESLI